MTTAMSVPRTHAAALMPTDGFINGEQLKARMDLILDVARHVMVENIDFGTIPGTDKPSLWKPGAEKLCVAFRIAAGEPTVEDLSTGDEIRYRVQVPGVSQINSTLLGVGVGECSTSEKKYKWRNPVHANEFKAAPADRKREAFRRDGTTYQQLRTDPADLANTVLKMAHKRAMVAMALLVTGASAIFSQDLEDLPEEMRESGAEGQGSDTKKPQRQSAGGTAKASAPPADALSTEPVAVKSVRKQERDGQDPVFWIETGDGQSYSTFDGSAAKELESFVGTDHKVRIGYVERKSRDGKKTYRNFVSVAIADEPAAANRAAPAATADASTAAQLSEQDIFGNKK